MKVIGSCITKQNISYINWKVKVIKSCSTKQTDWKVNVIKSCTYYKTKYVKANWKVKVIKSSITILNIENILIEKWKSLRVAKENIIQKVIEKGQW